MTPDTLLMVAPEPGQQFAPWLALAETQGLPVVLKTPDELLAQPLTGPIAWALCWLPPKAPQGGPSQVLKAVELQLSTYGVVLVAAHHTMASQWAQGLGCSQQVAGFSPLGIHRQATTVTLSRPKSLSKEAQDSATGLMQTLGLAPAWIADTPGLVLPRIYAMLANEAAFALMEAVASPEDIDTAMRLGTNYPMGPLAWADAVGLDEVLWILEHLCQVYRQERYRPCLLLQQLVAAGHLGVKTGRGFLHHSPARAEVPVS